MRKNRAILKIDFCVQMTFRNINYKGRKGRVRKANKEDKEDYIFTPFAEGGMHELWVYESDLKFY